MKLLVLFLLSPCVLACGWGSSRRRDLRYPFLLDASRNAVVAFNNVINNHSLTKNEMETKLEEWAEENDLKVSYEQFSKRAEEQKKQTQEDITKALEKLVTFFEELSEIENDKNLTIAEARRITRKIYGTLNARTSHAAACIAGAFAMELQGDDLDDYGWFGGHMRGPCHHMRHGGRWARSGGKQKRYAKFAHFMEIVGLGYPWYSGGYRAE
ncbi:hypothetical protein ANCCAN_07016 [Ancylostoma caninum]|uniref:SXP/RAL-2 family protein Ani s 5-like cation-binding domain-containing protein n=1 Tax=Ancylostoma caninum TaxID=29170 RepID=A0A368GRJ0_ANCCA|nr:hypothetical protein ANCCAN_07016 [Ancylostoma caninum]